MKPNKIKIHKIKSNPNNPRLIRDNKFKNLVNSIIEFPEMLKLRPIVVDEKNVILGGNMRYKACQQIGLKEVYVIQADDLTEKQKEEFIIKDNVGFGEWDWDLLANDWTNEKLNEWGLDVWEDKGYEVEDFFTEEQEKDEQYKIVLDYTKDEYDQLIEILNNAKGSKESIIYNLLTK